MKPAPPFDCADCGRRIGKTRGHILIGYPETLTVDRVVCPRCMLSTRTLHARFYPNCDVTWHDLHDHPSCSGTRAGIAHVLGLWP